jgi:O-antigen ligase
MNIEPKNQNKEKTGGILNSVVFILNLMVIIFVPVVIVKTRGIFVDTFEKYSVDVPAFTKFLLSVSGAVYFVIFFLIAIVLIVKEIFIRKKTTRLLINILISIIAGIVVLIYAAALMIPLFRCLQASVQSEFA